MQQTNSLVVDQLNFDGGGQRLIRDVSFKLKPGSRTALVGLNGAGKSTLLKLIVGEIKPGSGTIRFGSASPGTINFNRTLGYQAAAMQSLPAFSVEEYLDFCMLLKAGKRALDKHANNQLANLWGLSQALKHSLTSLSQGNLQKVSVCQAFLGEPECVILDEPTQALDPLEQQRFIDNLKSLKEHQTCLFSSHHISEAVTASDSVLMFDQGRLIAQMFLDSSAVTWIAIPQDAAVEQYRQTKDMTLVFSGKKYALYQIKSDLENESKTILESLKRLDERVKILGHSKSAIMPIFSMLANQDF